MRFNEMTKSSHKCPHCGGPMFSEMLMMEKKDACYYKVKSSAKVWPSAYASGRLVQCRKKGAANYGNKSEGVAEGTAETPQQQQVRAAITKGMEKWDQNDKATYQSQPTKTNYMPASGYASDKLTGVDSIDPDGTVVLAINDTKADGIVKKLATLGGMPGVKTRQIQPKIVQGMAENIRVEPVARPLKTQSTQTQPKQNVYVAPDKKTPAVVNHIKQKGLAEGLHPMVIADIEKLATLNPADRYSAYSNIRGYFKADPELSKMASDLMGGYYEADMLRGKYKTAEAKAKYAELEPMNQAFIKQALGHEQGLSEDSFDSPAASAITRRILMQRADLLSKYGPEKVTAAIDEVADFVGDVEEIGSSDVSGWIKQVEQSLAGMGEEVAVTTGNPPLEETTALQGQYGHSGKLQTFDDVEEDVLHRLRELSGMIRS